MDEPILKVEKLKKYFPIKGGLLGGVTSYVKAVDEISFEAYEGETVSIVGESGCGKSSAARSIIRLDEPTSGNVFLDGINLMQLNKKQMRDKRKDIQMIFQNPFGSLNPRQSVRKILLDPLNIQNIIPKSERNNKVQELLKLVGLRPDQIDRYPHEFSGGQRQRIGIARALATNPKVIICDEIVSALDVSIQAQILNLMVDLQEHLKITFIFVTHDLSVVRYISDRILVMYLGEIVEIVDNKSLFKNSQHPYTKTLLSSIPSIDPEEKTDMIELKGEIPSPMNPPSGCRFHTRCPFATEICKLEKPELLSSKHMLKNHKAACHHKDKIHELKLTKNWHE